MKYFITKMITLNIPVVGLSGGFVGVVTFGDLESAETLLWLVARLLFNELLGLHCGFLSGGGGKTGFLLTPGGLTLSSVTQKNLLIQSTSLQPIFS